MKAADKMPRGSKRPEARRSGGRPSKVSRKSSERTLEVPNEVKPTEVVSVPSSTPVEKLNEAIVMKVITAKSKILAIRVG